MVQKSLALVAAVAAVGVAAGGHGGPPPPPPPPPAVTGWNEWPEGCTPISYEPYVCDDEHGHEYTTTYTLYPKTCTLWYPYPTPSTSTWNAWNPEPPVEPTTWATWTTENPPESTEWSTWNPVPESTVWSTWNPEPPQPTWAPYPPPPPEPTTWATWVPETEVIIITLIETYSLPCPTGWEYETTTIYTTHCGCEATPVPVAPPYVTYTTECPESWGLGPTVTVIVPAPTWTPNPAVYTWLPWTKPTPEATSTWAPWTSTYVEEAKTTTWATWSTPAEATTATWSTWYSTPVKPETGKPTAWSPVASWQGAASTSSVSKIMVAAAGAVAGLALFL